MHLHVNEYSSHHLGCQEVSSWHWVRVATKGWPVVQERSLGCSPQCEPGWEGLRYTHLQCRPNIHTENERTYEWRWRCLQIKKLQEDSQPRWWCNLIQGLGCGACSLQKVLSCCRLALARHHHVTGRWNKTPKRHWPGKVGTTWRRREETKSYGWKIKNTSVRDTEKNMNLIIKLK